MGKTLLSKKRSISVISAGVSSSQRRRLIPAASRSGRTSNRKMSAWRS